MTRRLPVWANHLAIASLLALLLPAGLSAPPAVLAADPEVISSVDFDDGTTGSWTQSGSPTLTFVDDGTGGQALSILRAQDFEGIQSPTGLLEHDTVYTLSMRARLPEGTAGSTEVRLVVKPGFTWVGNATIDGTGWTTISGTYTLPAADDPAASQVYVGSTNQAAPYTILVDDILITAPAAPPTTDVISSVDFDDGTTGTWTQSGSPTLSFVDDGAGGQALSILRAQDFEGIQSPTGLLEHDILYTFSMRARLPEGTAGSTNVRFVVKPQFTWVANTTVDGTGWTTISGTYTLPAEVDPSAGQVYIGSDNQAAPYTILVDDILITAPAAPPPTVTVLSTDFEDGLDGWVPRGDAQGDPTVALTADESHSPTHAALVSDRTSQGDGIGHDVTGIMDPGTTYVVSAWVKFAAGNPTDTLWLSMRRTNGGTDSFDTLGQFTAVSGSTFGEVTATYAMGEADSAFIYFESRYPDGTSAPFLVDDITIESQAPPVVEDLPPVKDSVDFPLGSAIDSRETTGASSELLLRHFDQVTPENHMKPEAWYDDARTFRIHPEAQAIMDFAQDNELRVYGHTLVWHSQTPAWFFQHDDGTPLTTSDGDRALLRTRLHDHIFDVAETLSDMYGPFGSDTNSLIAFDVVNEVVSDGTTEADGLRRSPWYNILGESFIDDAFVFANEAFNETYAADAAGHPVTLAINDYNTEQSGKRGRMHALVERLLDRGVPVDAVGHQFHLSLSTPVGTLEEAIAAFEDLPVTQVVSEMDVTTGTPVDSAKLIDQGYYYRDAFRIFRAHSDDLFAVTLWGLHDARSWRSAGAPLLFDGNLKAKPAYFGAVDGELDARLRSAFVFQGSVALGAGATAALEWQQLPLHRFGDDTVGFQLRWEADHLTAYVEVNDGTPEAADAATFVVGDTTYVFRRDGTGDVPGVVDDEAGGWKAVVHPPLSGAAIGGQLSFDVSVTDGADTAGWNDAGAIGTLTLVEPVSFTGVAEAATAPVIDGETDAAWAAANTVATDKQIEGSGGASAAVKTLWQDNTLYVLAHVTDPILDDTGSDPWIEDSVEIYVDAGNVKNGSYRFDDTQIRINFNNVTSFGTGDEAFQANRLTSATKIVPDGYVVEASISLLEAGGLGTFHGLDFQVNDATAGARTSIRNWADPTGLGYQSTSRWGVGRLVAAPVPTSIQYAGSTKVKIGKAASFGVVLSAAEPSCVGGMLLSFAFDRDPVTGAAGPAQLGEATTNADGRAKLTVGTTGWMAGTYELTVSYAGDDLGCAGSSTSTEISVVAKGGPNQ